MLALQDLCSCINGSLPPGLRVAQRRRRPPRTSVEAADASLKFGKVSRKAHSYANLVSILAATGYARPETDRLAVSIH